jgi:hypothetical protein
MSAVIPINQWLNDAAEACSQTDLRGELRAALRANTGCLAEATGLVRRTLLLERAQICEELAWIDVPTFRHYRKVAAVYRQEADTLNSSTHSDLHDGEGEKSA